jgi:hypothetical protein
LITKNLSNFCIGTCHEQYIEFGKDVPGDVAEAVYSLVNAPSIASFSIQARHQGHGQVVVQYRDSLSSLNNPVGSRIDLGFEPNGVSLFVLSGSGIGSPFVSSNPPSDWMQQTFAFIGSKSLREIALPASHNAGMSRLTGYYGGIEHNTLTQSVGIYQQAENGARHFDIRVVYRHGRFYTGHFSKFLGGNVGGTGVNIVDIVHDLNRFTSVFPGELIILDISHDMNIDRNFRHFTPLEWHRLYQVLDGLVDLWVPPSPNLPDDLSTLPLSFFVTPGSRSAIIIRLPDRAPQPLPQQEFAAPSIQPWGISSDEGDELSFKGEPPTCIPRILHHTAFIHEYDLPITGSYSNTEKPDYLSNDQISKMNQLHPSPQEPIFMSVWTLTERWLHMLNVAYPAHSIIGGAAAAQRSLFRNLWPALSKTTYPNLIQVDDIHDKQVLALAIAINHHFANPITSPPARRDTVPGPDANKPPAQKCSWFDKWAHWWNFYPADECHNPRIFHNMAKNAQELARQWAAKERADEEARLKKQAAQKAQKAVKKTSSSNETEKAPANCLAGGVSSTSARLRARAGCIQFD